MNDSHFKGKKVFVTGGTGLVGSHLVESLVNLGARVIVLFRELNPKSYFFSQHLQDKVTLVAGDLKNFERLVDIVTKHEIEYIFHIGAQAIVDTAYHNPLETLASNILGTAHILECARLHKKIKGVIIASSDKAYGKTADQYTEDSPLKGDHPYDCSKTCTDLLATTYFKTYGVPIAIARCGNIYGPGDFNFNRIVPGIIDALLNNRLWEIRSNGRFVRDYLYIKDAVSAYITLGENIENIKGEAFNFSTEDNLSVLDLLAKTEQILKQKVNYKILDIAKNEIPYQKLNYTKAQKVLRWNPQYTFDSAISETYSWYKNNIL
ncbi:MAG: GDP-mannose 4,6-dehydratase [Candidatus Abawacabacteria bacterium]|nr:GDP-mannose 4,6-dehydratase [Candidatus Abawacabacteria bacterium]